MLEVRDIRTFYGAIQALKGVSIWVTEGEIVALIGANGAGKSTLLMTICGVVPPRSGEILFMGNPIQNLSPDRIFSLGIVQVPEGRRIFPLLTVQENLDMGAYLRNDKGAVRSDMEYVFSIFPRLAERRRQLGGTLSGGEQQMLALSRGLMARPRMLLLDEPSLGLAPVLVATIFDTIRHINRDNSTTLLLVEQKAAMALHIAGRGYVLENGTIKLQDIADQLLCNKEVKSAYLGGS
ncbi:MAG: ABC transporter ATP-binding protein [Desulfobacteraceae bacterium]|jgi:branched-chain amino acid transport system ATP-binding protein|nr:MAG: ABC transporter ATP-binding protein [Desulfobacteraceae bacterium]